MKRGPVTSQSSWFIVFCLVAIAAIVVCNLWSLYWGHCVVADFLRVPLIGWGLIGANLVAGLVFIVIKRRHHMKHIVGVCSSCDASLRETWAYCPNCGEQQCL